jgi:pyridoxamine 5'-phosphate oxidase
MNPEEIAALRKEYINKPMELESLEKDPFELFFTWFKESRDAAELEPNAMALATADSAGKPSLRMVLLKGLEDGGFYFYTNYESRKGKELDTNPNAALLFWWQTIERQVRIEGVVSKAAEDISDRYFDSRPVGSQIGAIVSPQSRPISGYEALSDRFEAVQTAYMANERLERPKHWGGYLLIPHAFEFWQGRENRLHDRFRFELDAGGIWVINRLAP